MVEIYVKRNITAIKKRQKIYLYGNGLILVMEVTIISLIKYSIKTCYQTHAYWRKLKTCYQMYAYWRKLKSNRYMFLI